VIYSSISKTGFDIEKHIKKERKSGGVVNRPELRMKVGLKGQAFVCGQCGGPSLLEIHFNFEVVWKVCLQCHAFFVGHGVFKFAPKAGRFGLGQLEKAGQLIKDVFECVKQESVNISSKSVSEKPFHSGVL
jgi:predicted transcriptional regulator